MDVKSMHLSGTLLASARYLCRPSMALALPSDQSLRYTTQR